METTVNYSIAKNGNEFRWTADNKRQFRAMRSFLVCSTTSIEQAFVAKLVDKIDDLLDLKPGEERFFVCSKYDCIVRKSLAELNASVGNLRTWIKDGDVSDNYYPSSAGFTIKRTNKLFVYHTIFENYEN